MAAWLSLSAARRRLVKLAFAGGVVAIAIAVSGCGSDSASSSPVTSGVPAGSDHVPADSVAFVSVDSDLDSAQWEATKSLLDEIPGATTAVVNRLTAELRKQDMTYETDIAPALGARVLVAVSPAGKPVILTQPDDRDALVALVAKLDEGGTPPVIRDVDGWTVVAEKAADIDAYERALENGALAGDPAFESATSSLAEPALTTAYVRGDRLGDAASAGAAVLDEQVPNALLGPGLGVGPLAVQLDKTLLDQDLGVGPVALALTAEDGGWRLSGTATTKGAAAVEPFEPELLGKVPDDAFIVVSAHGSEAMVDEAKKALSQAGGDTSLGEVEDTIGVPLEQVLRLLDGELVLYVREATLIPEVTIVAEPGDAGSALTTLETIARRISSKAGGDIRRVVVDGHPATQVVAGPLTVTLARVGDDLVATTNERALADLAGTNDKLVDDERFKSATEKVGYDGETSGLLYVDVQRAVSLASTFAGVAGEPLDEQTREILASFDYVVANSTRESGTSTFDAFVALR